MTPKEFKELRLKLGLTQKELAEELGYKESGDRLIRGVEKGEFSLTNKMRLHFELYAKIKLGRITN